MRDLCQGGSKSSKGGMTITTGTVIPTPQEANSSVISSGWDWAVSGKFMRLQSWQPRICFSFIYIWNMLAYFRTCFYYLPRRATSVAPLCFISCQERHCKARCRRTLMNKNAATYDGTSLLNGVHVSGIWMKFTWYHLYLFPIFMGTLGGRFGVFSDFLSFAQAEWLTKQFKVMNWNAIPLRIFEDFKHYKWSLLRFSCRCQRCIALRFWRTSTQMNQQEPQLSLLAFKLPFLQCHAWRCIFFGGVSLLWKVGSQLDMEETFDHEGQFSFASCPGSQLVIHNLRWSGWVTGAEVNGCWYHHPSRGAGLGKPPSLQMSRLHSTKVQSQPVRRFRKMHSTNGSGQEIWLGGGRSGTF